MNNNCKEIVFGSDTADRKRFFRAASFAHPAKMILPLQIYLIENYTKPGEMILDPMAGSGTILIACTLGRNVICVELENKFVKMQQDNWQKIKSLGPMLGHKMGEATILQGDARQLENVLVDSCIFSPPYAETNTNIKNAEKFVEKTYELKKQGKLKSEMGGDFRKTLKEEFRKHIPDNPSNIGNLRYGEIDAVISSPPYALGEGIGHSSKHRTKCSKEKYRSTTYTDKVDAVISSPPYDAELTCSESYKRIRTETGRDITKPSQQYAKYSADAIISSPPYEGTKPIIDKKFMKKMAQQYEEGKLPGKSHGFTSKSVYCNSEEYAPTKENIGNLKGQTYLEAILQVYRRSHAVLKPKGLMCLVTKNFIRNKKIVRLDFDTIKLCEKAGFTLIERLKRKLTQQSFWRTIYYQRYPTAPKIEHEDILIFKKGQRGLFSVRE